MHDVSLITHPSFIISLCFQLEIIIKKIFGSKIQCKHRIKCITYVKKIPIINGFGNKETFQTNIHITKSSWVVNIFLSLVSMKLIVLKQCLSFIEPRAS
jgi:hypothetical protein